MVGAGAKVLGPFRIGDNSKIAAGAVVLEEIPPDSTAVGIPARVVRRKGERTAPCADMDQVHIPDPVSQQLCRMEVKLNAMEKELEQLKAEQAAAREAAAQEAAAQEQTSEPETAQNTAEEESNA
jgi:serine O-acetyltransferase